MEDAELWIELGIIASLTLLAISASVPSIFNPPKIEEKIEECLKAYPHQADYCTAFTLCSHVTNHVTCSRNITVVQSWDESFPPYLPYEVMGFKGGAKGSLNVYNPYED